jgi:DNA-binding NtrC family response regulator
VPALRSRRAIAAVDAEARPGRLEVDEDDQSDRAWQPDPPTAHASPDFVDDAMNLGAFEVLDGPFELEEVEALVRAAHASRTQ